MSDDAIIILQDFLDALSDAVLAGDMKTCRRIIGLPYLHVSNDTRLVIETAEDMERGIMTFGNSLRAQGVNHFVRLATSAEFLSDDYIAGHCVNHILRNATPILPSFPGYFVLRKAQGRWKMVEVNHTIAHGSWPITLLKVPHLKINKPLSPADDARREAAQPLALYQTFLNALTQANVSGNFDDYLSMCNLPYTSHSNNNDTVFDTPEKVRQFFDMYSGMLVNNGVEDFARIAEQAEFLSSDMICGYHIGRFLRGGQDILAPIKSRMILRREGVRWKLKSVTNSISNTDQLHQEPVATDTLVTQVEIQERTKQ